MDFEKTIINIGEGSIGFTIPPDLARYLGIEPGDEIIIRDEKGKKGIYCSFWKKTPEKKKA